jgi:hypothetical protein
VHWFTSSLQSVMYTNQSVVRCDVKLCISQGYKQLHELYPPSDIVTGIKTGG